MNKHGALLLLIILLVTVAQSHGHTFFITSTQDATNATSLRGAIIEANRRGGDNMIILSSTNYPLTIQGADEDAALTGDLGVSPGTAITGFPPGSAAVLRTTRGVAQSG